MSTVEERCKSVMATVMAVDMATLDNDTNPITLAQWDSLANVQLILELEKEFDISISPEDGIEYITSMQHIIQYVAGKL